MLAPMLLLLLLLRCNVRKKETKTNNDTIAHRLGKRRFNLRHFSDSCFPVSLRCENERRQIEWITDHFILKPDGTYMYTSSNGLDQFHRATSRLDSTKAWTKLFFAPAACCISVPAKAMIRPS